MINREIKEKWQREDRRRKARIRKGAKNIRDALADFMPLLKEAFASKHTGENHT